MTTAVIGWLFGPSRDARNTERSTQERETPRTQIWSPELIADVRAGSIEAFEQMYRALYPRVFRVARRYLPSREAAEDVVHDAFLAVWDRRETLDVRQDIALYLITAVRHRAFNDARHQQYVRHVEQRVVDGEETPPAMGNARSDVREHLYAADVHAALVDAIDQLPELQRRIITFRWRTAMSYDAIAVELGITTKMVRLNLERAYLALRPLLRHLTEPD